MRALEAAFARRCARRDFRVAHYSIQGNHIHMIVEANDRQALGRGMKSIGPGIAFAVHRAFDRRGAVLAHRYHMRALKTPREVRAALQYVLLNARRHARPPRADAAELDPASSARWFDGWRGLRPGARDGPCTAAPRTRLLSEGWRRHGLLDPRAVPGAGTSS